MIYLHLRPYYDEAQAVDLSKFQQYGINRASKGYFGKAASEISIDEAAILAGVIRSPDHLSPIDHPDACKEARDHVLARMEEEKMITAETRDRLVALPVK
jgi:penicillin-binding protein 1A